jgi:antibiotic biosynthesis monooxygenase
MSDQDKPLFLVVTIKPRLDRLEEAEAQLQSMRRNTLQEPGCVFMHLVQPQDDPDTWIMLEMFRGSAARAVGAAPVRREVGDSGDVTSAGVLAGSAMEGGT